MESDESDFAMRMSGFEHGVVGFIVLCVIVGAFAFVNRDEHRFRKLIAVTTVATFVLVVLGAYVRLSDAGLGCPDWPGCYGNLTPQHAAPAIKAAESLQPSGPVTMAKAWKEMVHRYLAMIVGALIAGIMLTAWRNRRAWEQSPVLPTIIAAAVIFQAALGAWTVTLLLKPAIVTSHLLGGITILALLAWLLSRQTGAGQWAEGIMSSVSLRVFAGVALIILFAQVVLGGWVSTNYAALACRDLPKCHGTWMPNMDFANAFHVIRPLGLGPTGELLTNDALTAIHWAHRVGALVAGLTVLCFAFALISQRSGRRAARMLIMLLMVQILLGLSNVWYSLPLLVAVAHNGVAALLFTWLFIINVRLAKPVYT
jgi:heme a synthase